MSSSRESDNAISLFPFLAVLICTMGSLSVLLLVTTTHIRQNRLAKAEAELIAEADELARQSEEPRPLPEPPRQAAPIPREPAPIIDRRAAFERRVAELVKRRDAERRQSDGEQAALRTAQEKLESSAQQLSLTERELAEVRAAKTAHLEQREQLSAERSRLSGKISEAEQQLRKHRESKSHAVTKYAFVPYDGSSGTIRRPVLIECTERGLRFLQEDVTLTASDLDGFSVSFNPLAAGAAALIEYWQKRASGPNEPEPYVLLVVRPSGSGAYYAARKLLSRLPQPWGYELMAEDEKLDIPPEDLKASEALRTAISQCRRQKENRMRAMRNGSGPPGDSMVRFQGGGDGGGTASGNGGSSAGNGGGHAGGNGPGGNGLRGTGSTGAGTSGNRHGGGMGSGPGGTASGGNGPGGSGIGGLPRVGAGEESQSGGTGMEGSGGGSFAFMDEEPPFLRGSGASSNSNGPRSTMGDGNSANGNGAEGSRGGEGRDSANANGGSARGDATGKPGLKPRSGSAASNDGKVASGSTAGTRSRGPKNGEPGAKGTPQEPGPFDSLREGDAESGQGDAVANGQPSPNGARGRRPAGTQEQGERPAEAPPQTPERFDIDREFGSPDSDDPRKRWGLINRRATIGFTRKIIVQVTEREVFVGEEAPIPVGNGETAEQLARALRQNIEICTHAWGFPPQNFYWVPSLQFVVYPGGHSHYERMKQAAADWELTTSVKYKQAEVEPTKGQN